MNRLYLWLQHHPGVPDMMYAVVIGLVTYLFTAAYLIGPVELAVNSALVLAIAIRRVWFTAAYLLVIAAGLANVAFSEQLVMTPAHLAMPLLLYTAAAIGPRWARRLGLFWIPVAPVLLMWKADVYGSLPASGSSRWATLAIIAVLLAAPLATSWVCGDLARTRRQFYEEVADRAYRLEREREALDRAILAEERARIARELHDVVAHHVSVMVVQADGAAYAVAKDPEQATEALRTISRTGREAMRELRNLLGVLRADEQPDTARSPQPGLDGIENLVEQVQAAGVRVTYSVAGRPRPVSTGVSLAAFRVVQESLTNVLKHAGPGTQATVRLGWSRDRLCIDVTDDGGRKQRDDGGKKQRAVTGDVPLPDQSGGHGIIGMRERVTAVGGTLRAGVRPGGGYQVTATLPVADKHAEKRDSRRAVAAGAR